MALPIPSISGCISNNYNFFYKEKKALAFYQDKCCYLVLCLWLILFYYYFCHFLLQNFIFFLFIRLLISPHNHIMWDVSLYFKYHRHNYTGRLPSSKQSFLVFDKTSTTDIGSIDNQTIQKSGMSVTDSPVLVQMVIVTVTVITVV